MRTDKRRNDGRGGSGYNPMLTESATIRLDVVAASMDRVVGEVLGALANLASADDVRAASRGA